MLPSYSAKVQNAQNRDSWHPRPMFNWNDLKAFLAVAETGSTLSAAQTMRVSQTTIARRIAALEEALGLSLFDRRQAGYALTPAGAALVRQAEDVRSSADRFDEAAAALARDISGTVRLSTLEIIAVTVLAPVLRDLHAAHPEIHIELDTSDDMRDIGAGAIDIALRSIDEPKGGGLVGRRIADNPWTLYCSRSYAATHGMPKTRAELTQHPYIGGGGGMWPPYRAWLQRYELEHAVVLHHGSAAGILASVRSGLGLAVLPCFVADRDPDLIRCLPPKDGDSTGIWLLTHERLRHEPRVRSVLDFLARELSAIGKAAPSSPN